MSLTDTDLQNIRMITRDENRALEADVKEIYYILADMTRGMISDKSFQKLSLEDKLTTLNTELLATAYQAGVILPRQ